MVPTTLNKGDAIAIIAPAKCIEKLHIDYAVNRIEKQGFNAVVSPNCLGNNNYFSGSIEERVHDLQWAINTNSIKAIICARGGYGCIQIVDLVDWTPLTNNPKWIAGFSDITVFHQKLATLNLSTLHSTMPLNYQTNSAKSISTLFKALSGITNNYSWNSGVNSIKGDAEGELIGGNLSVLCSLIGTHIQPTYKNKILFIEDVGEAFYAVDRMLFQLKNSGILKQLKGIIVGDFSSMKDSNPPFGKSLTEIFQSHFNQLKIPVAYNFPAGHCDDNRTLIFGQKNRLTVHGEAASLFQ